MERKLRADTEGEFEIERELGRGGMAVVYLATDVHLRRKVAIKVLPPDLTFGKGTIERFRREAQTAAQLDHPNIIPVYRISTGGDLFWYAMKFIEGRSLDEILKDGMRFDLGGCIDILDQVASALDWAHRRQVVHRDVKPANIMIDPTGRVTMADFGIAKALSKTSLTASGSAIGTPNYMSPEQCMGGAITGAADQYALGVVTYQMLSGKLPFEADSAVELIQKHCFVPPPSLEEARPGLPKNVYTAVERALAKKSGERFPSVGEFVKALRDPSKASAGLSPRPSATPIPTDAPSPTAVPIDAASTTPIPVDEQSTTPIPAVTPDSIHEASTTPIPAATPGAIHEASTTPIPTTAPSATRSAPPHDDTQDGTPTEVIHQVGKHRRLGVAAAAMAALVVIAGAIGWLLVGSGGGGSTPPVAAQDDSGFGELDQERAIAVGVGAVADSEPPVAPGTREDLRAGPQTVAPPIDAPQAGGRPTETQQPPGEPSERLSVRGDTTPEDPPAARERRTEAAAAVAAADPGKPPADPKPPPAQERRTENERPVERTPPAPTGPGTIAWSQPAEYRGLGSPAVATDGRILVGSRALTRAGDRAAAPAVRGTAQSTPAVATSGTIYVGAGG
ncbi:MAG: protein kinase, partial [Gemmatimonadales bacterium]